MGRQAEGKKRRGRRNWQEKGGKKLGREGEEERKERGKRRERTKKKIGRRRKRRKKNREGVKKEKLGTGREEEIGKK